MESITSLTTEAQEVIEKTKAHMLSIMDEDDQHTDLHITSIRQLFLFQQIQLATVTMNMKQIGIFLKEIMDWETVVQITNIF